MGYQKRDISTEKSYTNEGFVSGVDYSVSEYRHALFYFPTEKEMIDDIIYQRASGDYDNNLKAVRASLTGDFDDEFIPIEQPITTRVQIIEPDERTRKAAAEEIREAQLKAIRFKPRKIKITYEEVVLKRRRKRIELIG